MRRLATWFVVVVLAGSGTLALAGPATAAVSRPASFCSTAKGVADKFRNLDPSVIKGSAVSKLEKASKKLAEQAPSSLDSAFKRINAFLKDGGKVPTDPADVPAYVEQSTKAAKALNKVFRYLSSKCHLDVG